MAYRTSICGKYRVFFKDYPWEDGTILKEICTKKITPKYNYSSQGDKEQNYSFRYFIHLVKIENELVKIVFRQIKFD